MYKILFTWIGTIVALLGVLFLFEPPHTIGVGLIIFGWFLAFVGVYEETSTRLAQIEAYQMESANHLAKIEELLRVSGEYKKQSTTSAQPCDE